MAAELVFDGIPAGESYYARLPSGALWWDGSDFAAFDADLGAIPTTESGDGDTVRIVADMPEDVPPGVYIAWLYQGDAGAPSEFDPVVYIQDDPVYWNGATAEAQPPILSDFIPGGFGPPLHPDTWRAGEQRWIAHRLRWDEAQTLASVTATIYDSAGLVVVNGLPGAAAPLTAATEHRVSYLWDTTGLSGEYRYRLRVTDASAQIFDVTGSLLVWPATSLLDRYLDRVRGWLQSVGTGGAGEDLSRRDYRDGLAAAALAYSRDYPRELRVTVTLTASDWTYPLSGLTGWTNDFSEIRRLEYPVDDTLQSRSLLPYSGWEIDERATVPEWRFVSAIPSAGETARVTYTVPHTLSHTLDTLPAHAFEGLTQYAAGVLLLGPLANQAAQTNDPQLGAEIVSYRDMQLRRKQQGQEMLAAGRKLWRRVEVWL